MSHIQVKVDQSTIEDALRASMSNMIGEGKEAHFTFRATRGEAGIVAEVDIVDEGAGRPVKSSAPVTNKDGTERKKPGPKPGTPRKPRAVATKTVAPAGSTGESPVVDADIARSRAVVEDTHQVVEAETPAPDAVEPAPETVETVEEAPAEPVQEAAPAATETRGSLFGNLTRPNNAVSEA